MKFFAYLKKLNKLGVAMTEYAVLLAFVAAIGASFTSDSGLGNSISGAVSKAVEAIGLVSGDKQAAKNNVAYNVITALDGTSGKGNIYDNLGKEILSGGGRFFEKLLAKDGIQTANMFTNYRNLQGDKELLYSMGLLPEGVNTNKVKLITIADQNGTNPTAGTKISATQYLVYGDSKDNMHIAATRHLSDVTIDQEGAHTSGIYNQGKQDEKAYSNQYDIGSGSFVKGDNSYNLRYIDDGFVAYKP